MIIFFLTLQGVRRGGLLTSDHKEVRLRPEIVKINAEHPEASLVSYVAEKIRAGEVVGMPTDTFYGLAADPDRKSVV